MKKLIAMILTIALTAALAGGCGTVERALDLRVHGIRGKLSFL